MSNKLIELKNLTKNFDDQQVLRGINLDIHENEFLTLLGPSGCGKTTTLRIIAGFEEPSGGEVLFNGIEISKLPPYKREINTVFQKYALFPHMNIAENIAFGQCGWSGPGRSAVSGAGRPPSACGCGGSAP